jgi:hypothetical protein
VASTEAPDTIRAARLFLLEHLDIHENSSAYPTDLDPAEVGIVGDQPHAATGSSYHLGRGQLRSDSYSIVESSRDRNGLSAAASAMDIGDFAVTVQGARHTLRSFSGWLVVQCRAGTPDTADIREVIYSLDGATVKRWDRLGRRATGDDSHRWHTHISYFRDSEKRDKTGLFRRYLTEIGLLKGGDDEMLVGKGDKGEQVRFWQYTLNDLGFSVGEVDGEYGAKTEAAVNAYRKWRGAGELTYISGWCGWSMLRDLAIKHSSGTAGPTGPAGPQGPAGPPGPKGDPGRDGALTGNLLVTGGQLAVETQ